MTGYSVSIIVPIYNAEKYIKKCVISLLEQDFNNIEYIFVNDCTQDNSINILYKVIDLYPYRKSDIKILNKYINEGAGFARKTGFEMCNGEYIIFIDSDDWVEQNMISSLYNKARDDDADIVCCDFFINYKNKEIYKNQCFNRISKNNYFKALLQNFIEPHLWDKLIRKTLFDYITFPRFSMADDMFITLQLFYNTNKISYFQKAFLHYNQTNIFSLTTSNFNNKKLFDLKSFYLDASNFLKKNNIYNEYIIYIDMFVNKTIFSICNSNYITNLKQIDKRLIDIRLVIYNKSLTKFQIFSRLLPYFGFEFIFNFIKFFYRKIRY